MADIGAMLSSWYVQMVNNGAHPVLALKGARIGDFNGRTLSTLGSSSISIDPDIQETAALRQWCAPCTGHPLKSRIFWACTANTCRNSWS